MPPRQIDPDLLLECCRELAARRANAGSWRPGVQRPPTCFLRVGEALGWPSPETGWMSVVETYVAAWAVDQVAAEIPVPDSVRLREAMAPQPCEGSLDWDETDEPRPGDGAARPNRDQAH